MGDCEVVASVAMESSLEYHSLSFKVLTVYHESGIRTLSVGQFDWGGRLLKSNGGAQRFPQNGWKSFVECNGIRELYCETYKSSSCESRT